MSNKDIDLQPYAEIAKELVKRIPYVLGAFVVIALIVVGGLVSIIGYLPMNQRLLCGVIVCVAICLYGVFAFCIVERTVKYIVKRGHSELFEN